MISTRTGDKTMTTKSIREFGSDAADVAAGFFIRNVVVIVALGAFVLIALARP